MYFKRLATSLVLSLTLVLFSGGGAFSADFTAPTQKIEGADAPIPLGDIVFLNLSPIDEKPANYVKYSVDWKVFQINKKDSSLVPKTFRTMPDGSIFFGSGVVNSKFKVFASVSYLYVVKDKDGKFVEAGAKSSLLVTDLVIGEDNPNPGPDPVPDPKFPDGEFKLAATSYKLVKDKVATKDQVASVKLANSFNTMAAKIAAGQELSSEGIKQLLRETTESNRQAIKDAGVENEGWDAFFTALQDVIYDFYSGDKLKNKQQFVTAWKEISEGLKAVK